MPSRTAIRRLQIKALEIPFKVGFRHASAERTETSSLWVEAVSDAGATGYGEACPRPYVTGETLDTAHTFFSRHEVELRDTIVDLASLAAWMTVHAEDLDRNPAAWCAIELAILDALARDSQQTIEAFLSLPTLQGRRFSYTAVVGDAEGDVFRANVKQYRRYGFTDFKLKLSGNLERDREHIEAFGGLNTPGIRIRVDANNLWNSAEDAVGFLRALDYPFFAIEEPLRPNQYDELAGIAEELDCRIILDESLLRAGRIALLPGPPARWLVNLRVSKMGGLLRSLAVVDAARTAGIGLIVGAQVGETSLLTRAALPIAVAAGDRLIAQEGAFGTWLLARDVCDPPLMFQAGGVLDVSSYPSLEAPGFGLAVSSIL